MASKFKTLIEVDGLREFNKALAKVADDMPNVMKEIHGEVVAPVVAKAKRYAPRGKTGKLAASVRPMASKRSAAVAAGKKNTPYANVIHWGWKKRNIRPQSFMTKAINASESEVMTIYEKRLDDLVTEIMKREAKQS